MKRIAIVGMCALFLFSGAAFAKTWTVGFVTGVEKGVQSGFVQMASQGLYKARQEFGFKVITETPENVTQESMAAAFRKLVSKNPDLVLATGFQMFEHVKVLAPLHPQMLFLVIDVPVEDMPNVMSVRFASHEGSFLAGALAGWTTKTGTVGVIMGVNVPTVIAFFVGFKEGVAYADPKVGVKEAYITKMPDFSGFIAPEKAAALAKQWYEEGVDIIFSLGSTSGNGIIRQARQDKKFAIGVDFDQDAMAKGHVLTSMLKKVDMGVYLAISKIMKEGFQPGATCYGLKENAVGLSEMKYTRHLIPDAVIKDLKDAERRIISGELKVTDYLDGK